MAEYGKAWRSALTSVAALVLVSACDNGPSAVATRDQAPAAQVEQGAAWSQGSTASAQSGPRSEPVAKIDGKPLWSSNRRMSAQENAAKHFERNGADFGARDVDDFVRKAHAFIDSPPAGTLRFSRANGDLLLYAPKTNVFAVATKDGAPRTMFKPDDGMAYWERQKENEAKRQTARSDPGGRSGGDEG